MRGNGTASSTPSAASNPEPATRLCEQCGSRFVPKRQTKGRFCTADCYRTWWKTNGQREYSRRGLERLEALRAEGRDPRSTDQATHKRRMAFRNSALVLAEQDDDSDDGAWAERGAYWQEIADPPEGTPSLWARVEREPLILSGHGVWLRVNHGALEIKHGFTHYPQKPRTQLLFPGDRRMPSRIVLIDVDGMITFNVIEFLSCHDVPLVVLDWRGRVVSTLGGKPVHADLQLRKAQLEARENGLGLQVATDLIRGKVAASTETLLTLPASDRVERGLLRLVEVRQALAEVPVDMDALRMLEARAAVSYFAAWLEVPIRWKGTARRPIPPEWRRMPLRGSLLGERNRHSTHPVNSALNYAYGVLESQVRQACAVLGLNLAVGYLHVPARRRDALVYDLMEPWRPVTDRGVLGFVRSHTFSATDVFLTQRGICRLHPQLARAVASLVPTEREVRERVRVAALSLLPDAGTG